MASINTSTSKPVLKSESLFNRALAKSANLERLTRDEALAVGRLDSPGNFKAPELVALGQAAFLNRKQRFGTKASWIYNLHINSSNICSGGCAFCAFAVSADNEKSYVLTEDEIITSVRKKAPSEVHIVGGLNREWNFKRNLNLVKTLKEKFPDLSIKGFTAVEMAWFAKEDNKEVSFILEAFKSAGLEGMPGGGAEVFSSRVRKMLCPDKLSGKEWLSIHKQAHRIGLWTNATMLYNCGERVEEQIDHLLALRELQDKTEGFTSFIPLAYQPYNNSASEIIDVSTAPTPAFDLKIIALSRLVLDNFPHIKAYWPMIGIETAATGLSWGADDLDGTLEKERIAHSAGAKTPHSMTRDGMEETITLAGFDPWERNGNFEEIS
jgi:aminodeoxyfutalosine synthase